MKYFARLGNWVSRFKILKVYTMILLISYCRPSVGAAAETDFDSCTELCRMLMNQIKPSQQEANPTDMQETPLTARQLLDHAANRFGYGLSSNEKFISDQDVLRALKIASNSIQFDAFQSYPFYNDTVAQLAKAFDEVLNVQYIVPDAPNIYFNPILDSIQDIRRKSRLIGKLAATLDEKNRRKLHFLGTKLNSLTRHDVAHFRILVSAFQSEYSDPLFPSISKDKHSNLSSILEEFWFNHFNVDYQKIGLNAALGNNGYEVMIHNKMNTTFLELLQGVINHVAMLRYLDNDNNIYNFKSNKASNQNLGRELMELHTLGEGADGPNHLYGQTDVDESAKMLTGLNVVDAGDPEDPVKYFYGTRIRPTLHVPDFNGAINTAPRIMSKRFCLYSSKVLDDPDDTQQCDLPSPKPPVTADLVEKHLNLYLNFLANHSKTKKNICDKLTARFVTGKWLRAISKRCQEAWGSGGDLKAMYKAIIWSPEVWTRDNYLNGNKTPNELAISAIRASGMTAHSLISDGDTWSTTVRAVASKTFNEIDFLGLPYRNWMTPTGYPQDGWKSKGLLVRWLKSSFNLANILESMGGNGSAPIMRLVSDQGLVGSLEEKALSLATGRERLLLVQKALGYSNFDGMDVVRAMSPKAQEFAALYLSPLSNDYLTLQLIGDTPYKVPVKSGLIIETSSSPFLKK